MNKLTSEQYSAARRMIDEEVIGAYGQHKGKILDSWYDKLASILQIPLDAPEVPNDGHCPQCGADVTQPDIPYAHRSVYGRLMPGHTDAKIPEEIKDLIWHDEEYEVNDKRVNDRLVEAYKRGRSVT